MKRIESLLKTAVMLFVRIRRFFVRHAFVFKTAVRHAFVFKTAVRELYFAKNFVRETIIKFFSYSCCIAKKCSFSRFVSAKNFCVRVALQNQKSSYSCLSKNLNSRIFVFVFSKKCAQTKNLRVRGSAQTKNLRKKDRNLRVRNLHVSSKSWRKKRYKRLK